jgi:beta-N-acetylhexosaminidase
MIKILFLTISFISSSLFARDLCFSIPGKSKIRIAKLNTFLGIYLLLVTSVACKQESSSSGLPAEDDLWVENTLKNMSVEQKLGQLLAPAISSPSGDADTLPLKQVTEWISKYKIGHVYIAGHRMDPLRTATFLNDIQRKTDIPILIHSDFECGPGDRVNGGTIFPPLMGIAQTRSEDLSYKAASITAKESRAMGIHLINSPVLDVNINYNNPVICIRSFGDNPALVTAMGKAYVRGLNDNGLIGAAKHFPGHGDVSLDSHSEMPTIKASRARLDSVEFFPYKEIIPSGLKAIMTAHISVPVLDPSPGLPATMSKPILTDLLRGKFGFNGLIITDAFDMGGILNAGSFEECVVKAIIAGNDIVELWATPHFELVFPYMLKAFKDGRISESRLNESVRRILIVKAEMGLHKEKFVDTEKMKTVVDAPEHREIAREIYEQAIVLVKNEGTILPLPKENKRIAVLSVNDDTEHLNIADSFFREMKMRGNISTSFAADPETPAEKLDQALADAQKADIIVVGLFVRIFARRGSPSIKTAQLRQFLNDLTKSDKPVFIVSFGSPYLITNFPDVDGYMIATEPTWDFYGYDKFRPGQIAAARALFGETDINGKLAVKIPELYPFGSGLTYRAVNK